MTQTKVGDPSENIVGDAMMIEVNEVMVPLWDDNPLPITITPSGTQDVNLTQVGWAAFALGQQLATASIPIVLTDAQITTLTPVAGLTDAQLRATPVPVSGTVLVTGVATAAAQATLLTELQLKADLTETQPVSLATNTPLGNVAHDAVDSGAPIKVGGKASSTAPTAVAANDRVDGYFDLQGRQIVAAKSTTGTLSNVASSATNVTLLAANTARLWATVYNDSTQTLYVKFGATASSSSFTVLMVAAAYYEVPYGYTGIIDWIWASANGSARISEITA